MLKLILGTNWISNRDKIFSYIAEDVRENRPGRVLIVPELISHDMERNLCAAAGDTASRFAEVLSFTRLAKRVADESGHSVIPCMDEGGRVVAMAAAISQVRSKLKFFASVGTKPEFLTGLVETVDECKRCAVDPGCLMQASRQTNGMLAQKLEELSFIFEAYDGICAHGKKDPRDQLTWLLEELESTSYGEDHVFYIDGFADFTRQQIQILSHLIESSANVTVSLCCDRPSSAKLAFERPGETATVLMRIAREKGVPVEILENSSDKDEIAMVSEALFEGELTGINPQSLTVSCFESVYQECEGVSEQILALVSGGARYRDISVVCPDISSYESPLRMVAQRCGIPVYLSGTQSVLERPVIGTVVTALDAALSGFDSADILGYLKTAMSPLDLYASDLVENYVLLWSISGKKWTQPWQMHPRGLVDDWTEDDRNLLTQLNIWREKIMQPLMELRSALIYSDSASASAICIYNFLEQIQLAERLSQLSDRLVETGDLQNAQVLDQLWEILVNALEQIHGVLGKSIWDPDAFVRLFRILLSCYDVGTIPTVLDAVTIGDISSMRCNDTKHLFVLGAVEGVLPGYGNGTGVLTDQDRTTLRDLGFPLNGGSVDSLQTSFSEIYSMFRGATSSIAVSYPGGQPSYVYQRLKTICGKEDSAMDVLGPAVCNPKHTASYLLRNHDRESAVRLGIEQVYDALSKNRTYDYGYVSKAGIEKLYGKTFRLSASQIDLHGNCALSYFLRYGLRAQERKPASVDPAEFGTFVHDVLEKTARKIVDLGGFKVVSKEDSLQIAAEYAHNYMEGHFVGLDSQRVSYLLNRNGKELSLIVEELWNELHNSNFAPVMFELSFGMDAEGFAPIHIQGNAASAKVRGYVDRVDVWNDNGKPYFRVVDYKTGQKTFDYCDIINGIGLQMLLYLFALEQKDSKILGEQAIPAGVQYFPARVPVVSVENGADESEAAKERDKVWKRSGLLLNEEHVLAAMEPADMPSRMPFKRKKDGSVTGDLADRDQFAKLRDFVFKHLQKMVDNIASGNVTPNPYTRDARKNACRFCPYGSVCHKSTVEGRRIYKAISQQQFWADLEKEVGTHE